MDFGYTDVRVLGVLDEAIPMGKGAVLRVRVPLRGGGTTTVRVAADAAALPGGLVPGQMVMAWGELRDGNEVSVAGGRGEILVLRTPATVPDAASLPSSPGTTRTPENEGKNVDAPQAHPRAIADVKRNADATPPPTPAPPRPVMSPCGTRRPSFMTAAPKATAPPAARLATDQPPPRLSAPPRAVPPAAVPQDPAPLAGQPPPSEGRGRFVSRRAERFRRPPDAWDRLARSLGPDFED